MKKQTKTVLGIGAALGVAYLVFRKKDDGATAGLGAPLARVDCLSLRRQHAALAAEYMAVVQRSISSGCGTPMDGGGFIPDSSPRCSAQNRALDLVRLKVEANRQRGFAVGCYRY